jgi:hypothetical protein
MVAVHQSVTSLKISKDLDPQQDFIKIITANVGTEGADENFLFWDVFKELSVTQPVFLGFG